MARAETVMQSVDPGPKQSRAGMNETLLGYMNLLFKLFVDRTRFRGPSEFSFRILGARNHYRIRVRSRDGSFRRTIVLRRRSSDLATFEQVFANNDYNLRRLQRWNEIRSLYEEIAKERSPLILDLGANVGLASVYFAKNWPAAEIIAVEPDKENFRVMCENVAGLGNIVPINAAAASDDGAARIVNPNDEGYALRTEMLSENGPEAIPALSVASIMKQAQKSCQPFLIKIDIEGFESNLFSKNTSWMEQFPIIIIELHDWLFPGQGRSNNFLRAVAQQNRDFVLSRENVISLANWAR